MLSGLQVLIDPHQEALDQPEARGFVLKYADLLGSLTFTREKPISLLFIIES